MSNCAKGCIACSVCSAVVAAVMIPVGIFVIAPSMGQHALNVATMNIPISHTYTPDNMVTNRSGTIYNSVKLDQTAVPFPCKLHETDLVMHIPGTTPEFVAAEGLGWDATNLAWFTMPEQKVHHGENSFEFTSTFNIMQPGTLTFWSLAVGMDGGGPFPNGTIIHIVSKPKLTVMGMITMELKMGKALMCHWVVPPTKTTTTTDAPALELVGRRLADAEVKYGVEMILRCEDNGEMDDDLIDDILSNFTYDRVHNTATTTTVAPEMV